MGLLRVVGGCYGVAGVARGCQGLPGVARVLLGGGARGC